MDPSTLGVLSLPGAGGVIIIVLTTTEISPFIHVTSTNVIYHLGTTKQTTRTFVNLTFLSFLTMFITRIYEFMNL